MSQTVAGLTRRAAEAARAGDSATARALCAQALHLDPSYEPAWGWYTYATDDPGEKKFCLTRAVELRDRTVTRKALAALNDTTPVVPDELADLVDPDLPEDLWDAPAETHRRRRWWKWGLASLAVLGILGAFGLVVHMAGEPEPVYIAVAGSQVGEDGDDDRVRTDLARGVQQAVDALNADGGINGHEVRTRFYEDQRDPDQARERAEEIVADGRVLAVIGHDSTSTSHAAAPVYAAAGIPAITATSTGDTLTKDLPWYFQGIFDDSQQGTFLSGYMQTIMHVDDTTVIYGNDAYGEGLHRGFTKAFASHGKVREDLLVDLNDTTGASLDAAVAAAAADHGSKAIFLALRPGPALSAIPKLRAAGVAVPVIGADELSSDNFFEQLPLRLQALPAGAATGDVYATSPMLTDSVTGVALETIRDFTRRYGYVPDWPAATGHDVVSLIEHALRQPGMRLDEKGRAADRIRIRDTWAGMNSPGKAVQGMTSPLYFDDARTLVRPVRMGVAEGDRFVSAATQLIPASPGVGLDLSAELAAGDAIRYDEEILVPTQIVSTGVNINEIGDLDTKNGTFNADMYLWFRYVGDDLAVDVEFPNASDPKLSLGEPLEAKTTHGEKYRLYHVDGTFKAQFEFGRFPFDTQNLTVMVQNRTQPASRVTYVTDAVLGAQSQEERLRSAGDVDAAFTQVPNWHADHLRFYAETIGSSANVGDPAIGATGGIYYSQFVADVSMERNVGGFLTKNLLPLLLLILATYASLWLPYSAVTARVSMAVTGILSSAVMLNSVTGVLPAISYTVAIEWFYYLFILLCVGALAVGLVGDKWASANRFTDLRKLSLGARVTYPALILATVGVYVWQFS